VATAEQVAHPRAARAGGRRNTRSAQACDPLLTVDRSRDSDAGVTRVRRWGVGPGPAPCLLSEHARLCAAPRDFAVSIRTRELR